MKKSVFLLIAFCLPPLAAMSVNTKPFVIPELREWKGANGNFVPTSTTRIVYSANQPELLRMAERFADDWQTMFGQRVEIGCGKASAGDIILALQADASLGSEGYAIRISDRVRLTAPHEKGIYWGTRTLLQIAEQNETQSMPKGAIRDWPDYGMRGFMLDCGRKFIPLAFLKDYVRILSYYKMNTFQIHLNDNGFKNLFGQDWNKTYAAFRLESETYPGLTAEDGFYTKREFIELQRLADSLCVEIIPEIDAPAHSLAFAHYKPEIGSAVYGMDHLNLAAPETYEFMDGLWREYLSGDEPVFTGPRVNIGTDEYSNQNQEVVEQFRAFTDHYIRFAESFGKQVCMWGALTHAQGTTPVKAENVILNAWYNGFADPKKMVELGYKLISIPDGYLYIVPGAGYYQDYLNTKFLYENWTPAHVGQAVFEEGDPAIAGTMFALWNDHVGNGISTGDIHHRAYPAIQTLAVKMWDGASAALPYEAFDRQRHRLSEAPGIDRLGRIVHDPTPGLLYEQAEVKPESELPCNAVGYDYTVTFTIDCAEEVPGTELFRSDDAVFYLSDPIRGMLGFARDGYLSTFGYRLHTGKKMTVGIEGDNRATRLYIDGKMVEEMPVEKRFMNEKDAIYYHHTLVFPLHKAGRFSSRITDLKVYRR